MWSSLNRFLKWSHLPHLSITIMTRSYRIALLIEQIISSLRPRRLLCNKSVLATHHHLSGITQSTSSTSRTWSMSSPYWRTLTDSCLTRWLVHSIMYILLWLMHCTWREKLPTSSRSVAVNTRCLFLIWVTYVVIVRIETGILSTIYCTYLS